MAEHDADLAGLDAVAQADLVRVGAASPTELVDAAIARIEAVNPELNAVIHERFERARAEAAGTLAQGPLTGVPMVLKDLDGQSAGDPFHMGTRHLRELGFRTAADSTFTARLRRAGVVLVGRTNTPELGLVPTTEPEVTGPTRNPWNTGHSTGGSSGGSAAAVASGMVPLGHAGDGGGSIRIPASACGLVGLKPSRGRNSLGPEAGEAWGGHVARLVVTRSVRDTAVVLDAVHGYEPGDPYTAPAPSRPFIDEVGAEPGRLRIALAVEAPDPGVEVHPECVAAAQDAARLLESLGHEVTVAAPATFGDPDLVADYTGHFINAYSAWAAADLDRIGRMSGHPVTEHGVEAGTWAVAELGRSVSAAQLIAADDCFNVVRRAAAEFWSGDDAYDLLLTPTLTSPPPRLGEFAPLPDNPLNGLFRAAALVQFTSPFNTTGQPAVSLPTAWSADGLPIGVQLVAAYGREDLLLQVAAQVEQARPWADRRPPVHA